MSRTLEDSLSQAKQAPSHPETDWIVEIDNMSEAPDDAIVHVTPRSKQMYYVWDEELVKSTDRYWPTLKADIPEKYLDGTGLSEDDFVPNADVEDEVDDILGFIDEYGLVNPESQREGSARANQLKDHASSGEPLEFSFWEEIYNFHQRHRAQGNHNCDEGSLPAEADEINENEHDPCFFDAGYFSDYTWGSDAAYEQAERIVTSVEDAGVEKSWVPYEGSRGGSGWKETDSGRVIYDATPPESEIPSEESISESIEQLVDVQVSEEEAIETVRAISVEDEALAAEIIESAAERDEAQEVSRQQAADKWRVFSDTFEADIAYAVENEKVVDEIQSYNWVRSATDVENEDLLLEAYKQVYADGAKTSRERVRQRLNGLGVETERIRQAERVAEEDDEIENERPDNFDAWDEFRNSVSASPPDPPESQVETLGRIAEYATDDELDEILSGAREYEAINKIKTIQFLRGNASLDDAVSFTGERNAAVSDKDIKASKQALSDSLNSMDEGVAAYTLGELNRFNFDNTLGADGQHTPDNRIRINPDANKLERTVAHEFGHQVHKSLGAKIETGSYPDRWFDIEADDANWGIESRYDGTGISDEFKKSEKSWDEYQNDFNPESRELRQYQRRHGAEYMAVTFAHWVTNEQKIQRRDSKAWATWEKTVGEAEEVGTDEMEEGDVLVMNDAPFGYDAEPYKIIEISESSIQMERLEDGDKQVETPSDVESVADEVLRYD